MTPAAPRIAERLRKLLPVAGLVAGLIVAAAQVTVWLPIHWRRDDLMGIDVVVYHAAARNLVAGRPVYGDHRADLYEPPTAFLYPPPFVALLSPLAPLSPRAFQKLWYALMLVGFWFYAWALARLARGSPTVSEVLGTGFILCLWPGPITSLSVANADIFIWALVAWGLRGSPTPLAVGALLKVYPAIPLAVVALRRRGRGLLPALALSAAAIGLVWIAFGRDIFVEWNAVGAPSLATGFFAWGNVSLSARLVALIAQLRHVDLHTPPIPGWAALILRTVPPALTLLAAWLTRRRSAETQAIVTLLVAVWAAPICWIFRASLLLIPVAMWLRRRQERGIPTP
jgi:hypothetical protein